MIKIRFSTKAIIALVLFGCFKTLYIKAQVKQTNQRYNILFIAVDDLKPDLNCYRFTDVKSPNLDVLASKSTLFNANYCQQAICGPTRASLLTGLRPDKTKIWDLQTFIRDVNPNIVTLPQYFRQSGYFATSMGKIYDPRSVINGDEISWSEPWVDNFAYPKGYKAPVMGFYQSPEQRSKFQKLIDEKKTNIKSSDDEDVKVDFADIKISTENADVPDDAYVDGAMANYAIAKIKLLKNGVTPFFLAVGFKRPHLPFVAPSKYWDLYDRNKIKLAEWQKPSIDGPKIAYHNAGELRSFTDIQPLNTNKNELLKLSEEKQRELVHGYYACISYMDAQVGRVLKALKDEGLDQNTIVIFWGDHGWHLGDHSLWCKHSNFEQATRTPLIIHVPGQTKPQVYNNMTEFVDIYPTLLDLTGLPIPSYLDGKSLVPALKKVDVVIKDYAISQYPRNSGGKKGSDVMGYSLRNKRYRYTEWMSGYFKTFMPFNQDLVMANELYDYETDPNETKNLVNDPTKKEVVKLLSEQLHDYYRQQLATAGKVSN
jgi:arylsulfatase A-like enzyme